MLSRPTIAPEPGSPDAAGCALLEPRSVPSLPDRALASAASVGDRAAFEEIVRRHAPDMLRYATHLLSDRTTAEDVVQDALVDAWRGLRTFRADSSLRTWLYSVVSHKVVDQHRRRVPTPVEDWVFERPSRHHDDDPTIAATQKAFLGALDEALSELPYRQRACWLLHEVEGMRHTEIGTVMSLSPGAVRGHLTRARTTLSRRLETWT